jgi:antitoxin HigA-1
MSTYKILSKSGERLMPDISLHPGEVLEMELSARGIKKSGFAADLGILPSQLSELLHEKRHISASIAIRLEQLLGIDAEFWMRVQAAYDLHRERKKIRA